MKSYGFGAPEKESGEPKSGAVIVPKSMPAVEPLSTILIFTEESGGTSHVSMEML